MTKSEYKSARSLARKTLREGFKQGRDAHAKAWKNLGSSVYFFAIYDYRLPVSLPCCLFISRKYGRKVTDFI